MRMHRWPFALFVVVSTLVGEARAQSMAPTLPDASKCVVLVEDMGDVGFRISDSGALAEAVVVGFRKRLSRDGVLYGGSAAAASSMRKMLGPGSETQVQEAQLTYFKAATANAKFHVAVHFGTKGRTEWVTLECKRTGAKPGEKPLDSKRLEAKTFLEVRDLVQAAMPTFCPAVAPLDAAVTTTNAPAAQPGLPPGMSKPKPTAAWSPPPRRD